jgi:leucyl aminopeptidase
MNVDGNVSLPLWLLYEHEIEVWRAAQSAPVAQWLLEQNFKAEKHRVVLLAAADGTLAGAVGGLGRRQGPLSLWHSAGIAERLPARRFRLAQDFSPEEATQLWLGFAYGAYRFDRYRPSKSEAAGLEAPANADADGARLDQHADRGFRARAVRRRRPPPRRAPPGRLPRMGGRGSSRGEFPGHPCRGPGQQ